MSSLRRRDWVYLVVGTIVFCIACAYLSRWQFHRYEHRRDNAALVKANSAAAPAEISKVLPPGQAMTDRQVYRSVTASGRYDIDGQLLVRKHYAQDASGYWVLTPFRTDAGATLLVARGWVPNGPNAKTPPPVPAPPTGPVTVTGLLNVPENPVDETGIPEGQIARISLPGLGKKFDGPVYQGWLALTDQKPPTEPPMTLLDKPDTGLGPHLGYSIQWILFAVMAVVGFGVIVRRSMRTPEEL